MASIGNLVINIAANVRPMIAGMNTAIGAVSRFRAVVAAAAGVATGAMVRSAINLGSELQDMSDRVGVSVEALGALKFAAEQSDASFEALGNAFRFQAKFLHAASGGSKEAASTLAKLGLTLQHLQSLSPEGRFKAFAEALSQVEDPGQRAVYAMQIFGRGAAELLPLINQGAAGIAKMEQAAKGLGLLTGEEASNLERLGDAFAQVWHMISVGAAKVVAAFAPAILDGIQATINAAQDMGVIIGVTLDHLRKNWKGIFSDIGTIAVASLTFVWETAKAVTGNMLVAFQNVGKVITAAMQNAFAPVITDLAIIASRLEGLSIGRWGQAQADVESEIRKMQPGNRQAQLGGFQALPTFQMPADIPAITGLADDMDAALERDRAQRKSMENVPARAAGLDDDGNLMGMTRGRRQGGSSGAAGAVARGSVESFRILADALQGGDTNDQILEANKQQVKLAEKMVAQNAAMLAGGGGMFGVLLEFAP